MTSSGTTSGIRVQLVASAVRNDPVFQTAQVFADDPPMAATTAALATAAVGRGVAGSALRYLDGRDPADDVARRVLSRLPAPRTPQPLYVSRSGPEADPFTALLPDLVRRHDWISDALVLTHLEALTGSAVFGFLSWAVPDGESTVLLVDQQTVAVQDDLPRRLTAVALRTGPAGGTRVTAWGEGTPPVPAGARVLHGTRSCDAWLEFTEAVSRGEVAAGEAVVLHTRGTAQQGWVVLDVEEPPRWVR